MSTRRAGEGLRASSHFSDNSIESSVRGLTLGGGSGLYRGSDSSEISVSRSARLRFLGYLYVFFDIVVDVRLFVGL